jgi:hypothetical protein
VRRLEVLYGGESFTAAGIPCRRALWTLRVVEVIKKEENQAIALAVGTKAETQSGMGSRDPALKTAGCSSTYTMVDWRCSSNILGYQLFDH